MDNSDDFPSQHTGLQQNLFQKATRSNDKNKNRKNKARSDFDGQKRQSINILDIRLRQNATLYLSDTASSTDIIDKLRRDAEQVANGLREKTAKLFKDKLAKAETDRSSIRLNDKEERLVLEWGEINIKRLKIPRTSLPSQDAPGILEKCAEQATESLLRMIQLGHPAQYGSGQLGRTALEIIRDVGKGALAALLRIGEFLVWEPIVSDEFQTGCIRSIIIIAVFLGVVWGISDSTRISFFIVFFILIGLILGIGGAFGGLGGLYSEDEKETDKNKRVEKRKKLVAGCLAYQAYKDAEKNMPGLFRKKVRLLENQKKNDDEDANKQEAAMLISIDNFSAELRKAEGSFQQAQQAIDAEFQLEQQELKQEFDHVLEKLKPYSKLAIAGWSDVFWQHDFAQALVDAKAKIQKDAGEIRIGSTVYPGSNPHKETLPMLIDLAQCGHIFIVTKNETDAQASQLLKTITARMVFATPLGGAKFIFIDTKAAGVFAEFQQLPREMGNRVFSQKIQEQTQALEEHQKQMQGQIGNGDLKSFNLTAGLPEPQRILCITGYPNPNRLGAEAESHLENIIQSGARVGLHVILKINSEPGEPNHIAINPELCLKHGVILRPANYPGQWDVCFNGKIFPFVPDSAPDAFIFGNILRQIKILHPSMPILGKPMQVFLCHAVEDKIPVREVYEKLKAEAWLDPWLDEEKLYPGQDWDLEIEKALHSCAAVIVFLSNGSVVKEGYLQKELKRVMDLYDEKPEGTIYLIPLRLDECDVPYRLKSKKIQWVDYFPPEQRDEKFQPLLKALEKRYSTRPVAPKEVSE